MKKEQAPAANPWVNTLTSAPYLGLGPFADRARQEPQALQAAVMPPEWQDNEYRRAAMEAEVENGIAWQVRTNREERGLKQSDLAHLMGTRQSAISRLEDPDGGDVRVSTLIRAAHAFDCALLVRFVSYSDFAAHTADVMPDRLLACPFSSDQTRAAEASKLGKWPRKRREKGVVDSRQNFNKDLFFNASLVGIKN